MKSFDAYKEVNNIVNFIRKYYKKYNLKGAIIGISGGKDSAVVAALFTKALGKENVVGVTMPCYSQIEDEKAATIISKYYGFKLINVNLTKTFEVLKNEIKKIQDYNPNYIIDSDINLKPRLRMATLYYLAALYTNINKKTYLVAGTSNKSELYVGYFTKGGDSIYDISTIGDFTVEEVIKIGEILNVPDKILYKTPSDGLTKLTDEQKLGVSYKNIDSYIKNKDNVENNIKQKIKKLHDKNFHKFIIPTYHKIPNRRSK